MSTNGISIAGFQDVFCPVTFVPMTEAYSLLSCMHKVNKTA